MKLRISMIYGLLFLALVPLLCSATPVQTLVENGKQYDGRTVQIQGEVIGDILKRGNNAWINVLSPEGVAIGVLCTIDQTRSITVLGNYKQHGDTVQVYGTFHRFYKEQGGETAIVADSVAVIARGYPTPRTPSPLRIIAGCFLTIIGLVMWALYANKVKK